MANKLYGPYFFEENVNSINYLDCLKNHFWPTHSKKRKKYKNGLKVNLGSDFWMQVSGYQELTFVMGNNQVKSLFKKHYFKKCLSFTFF